MNRYYKANLMELARIVDRKSTPDDDLLKALASIAEYEIVSVDLGKEPRAEGKRVAARVRAYVYRESKKARWVYVQRKAIRALNTLGRDGLVELFRTEYPDVTYFQITEWMRGETRAFDSRAERILRPIIIERFK